MTNTPVVVIGGGAAGMMAALAARQTGAQVTLVEPNEKLGRKLYITGKGRCNLTNNTTPQGVLDHVPRNGRFLYSAVTRFPPAAVMAYFEKLGVPLKTERGGYAFFPLFRPGGRCHRRPVFCPEAAGGCPAPGPGRASAPGKRPGCGGDGGGRAPARRGGGHRHRRPVLPGHWLHRGRILAGGGGRAHHCLPPPLPGPPGGEGGHLRPNAGPLPEKRDPHLEEPEEQGGLPGAGGDAVHPLRPLWPPGAQRQRPRQLGQGHIHRCH